MDTFLISISLSIVVLGISLYAISLRQKHKKIAAGRNNAPPGSKGWPIIGETLEYQRSAQNGNPEKFITDRMNKYSPKVFMTSLIGETILVFCGTSGNKCLFSSDKNLITPWLPPNVKKILISPDNTRGQMSKINKEGRSVVNVFIKPEALQQNMVGVMDNMARKHIEEKWAPHQQVLVLELAKTYTFSLACRLFLGIENPKEVARLESLFEGITAGFYSLPINFPGTTFNRAIKYSNIFRKEVLARIKQRKINLKADERSPDSSANASQDILSYLLLSTDEIGEFRNDIDVADMVLGMFVAGHDTTSSIITSVVKYLAELPYVYAEVLNEQMEIANNKKPGELLNWKDIQKMKYSWNVANEAMRLAPPAGGTFKEVMSDFTFADFTISKGCKAHWNVHSTNRNPEYFKNPEKFDPSRFDGSGPIPYSFAPFGGGTNICPGREYARVKVLVFMHNLVTQFEWKKLIPDEKTIYIVGALPANGLPVRLHPRREQTN